MVAVNEPLTAEEAVAEAWASIDGHLESFRACRANPATEEIVGRYGGYMADAGTLIARIDARGYRLIPAGEIDGVPISLARLILDLICCADDCHAEQWVKNRCKWAAKALTTFSQGVGR